MPPDTTASRPRGRTRATFTLSATDALSGIDKFEYKINGGPALTAANGQSINVGADGTFTIAHRAIDVAGQATGVPRPTRCGSTPSTPANTSAVPDSDLAPDGARAGLPAPTPALRP